MNTDYGLYMREEIYGGQGWHLGTQYDIFISAYNLGERIVQVYDKVDAPLKIWLRHEEYGLPRADFPIGSVFDLPGSDESTYCKTLIDELLKDKATDILSAKICIDITGILRPHLMFLILYLKKIGMKVLDVIYAEPTHYALKEKTPFSTGLIQEVRPVRGFEGLPSARGGGDFLIMGMGYDDRLQAAVAENKDKAEKHQLFGLPSLRADMYQESVLRSRRAADELGDPNFSENHRSFAPANDPFGTASVLHDVVQRRLATHTDAAILLSPLGTKAQALGFAIYHIFECEPIGARIIFPFSNGYSPKTGTGLARAWLYRLEF